MQSNFEPNGPRVSVEFCRISGDGRVTLVIDEAWGADCLTYCATSLLSNLGDAVENLRLREGMPNLKGVGFVDLASDKCGSRAMERHPKTVGIVKAWARSTGYDAAVWTALASNFCEKVGEPFSVEASLRHLGQLNVPAFDRALNYIRQAPPEVQAPVRAAVNARWPEE